jgi:hypothetical protein
MYNGRSAIEKRSILNETMSVNYELVYSLKYFCRSYENDLFPCNNKSILMSILLLFGIDVCMESNKINLKLLNLGQISKKWLLSANEPLQFGQLVLSDKKSLNKCAFRLLASFLN